ncbi:hypothetical protein CPB83DRAFT_259344 [Crepidotus variabilis]|uniref:F-box domain-containing protein n=1 Tax=Crepidotus variabilis TaxID=179855 RepID=A0A9P6EIB8_9AGAR|nr:hypothetical protein CPB83DRAFT_259344 [Crepidotus variabilis]
MSSPFSALPLDLISEIFGHLEWNDLLRVRLLSHAFLDATEQRSIWFSLYQTYSSYEPRTLWPDRNISDYTTKELENLILSWKGVGMRWSKSGTAPSSENSLALSDGAQASQLIPGGRWLVSGMSSGDVHFYDLLSSHAVARLVIPVSLTQASSCNIRVKLSIDMEGDKFVFAFRLAVLLLPIPTRLGHGESVYIPADSCFIRIYRVTVDSTEAGSEELQTELLASHVHKSYIISYCYALSLLHNHVAYSIHHRAEEKTTFDSHLFVINWTKHPENEKRSMPGVYAGVSTTTPIKVCSVITRNSKSFLVDCIASRKPSPLPYTSNLRAQRCVRRI